MESRLLRPMALALMTSWTCLAWVQAPRRLPLRLRWRLGLAWGRPQQHRPRLTPRWSAYPAPLLQPLRRRLGPCLLGAGRRADLQRPRLPPRVANVVERAAAVAPPNQVTVGGPAAAGPAVAAEEGHGKVGAASAGAAVAVVVAVVVESDRRAAFILCVAVGNFHLQIAHFARCAR